MIKNLDMIISKFKSYYLKQVGEVVLLSYDGNVILGEIAYYDDQTETINVFFNYQDIKHDFEYWLPDIDDNIIPLRIVNLKNNLAKMHSGEIQKLKIWNLIYMLAAVDDSICLISSTKLLINSNDIDEGFKYYKGLFKSLSTNTLSVKGYNYTYSYKQKTGVNSLGCRTYDLCFFMDELTSDDIRYIKETIIVPFFNLGKEYVANGYNFVYEDQAKLKKEVEKKLTEFNIDLICRRFGLTRHLLGIK
jgi:hypothetical protein